MQLCWAKVKIVYFPKVYLLPNWGIEPRFWVHNLNLTPVLACLLIKLCVLSVVSRKTCFFQYWPPGHLLCLSCTGQYKRMVHHRSSNMSTAHNDETDLVQPWSGLDSQMSHQRLPWDLSLGLPDLLPRLQGSKVLMKGINTLSRHMSVLCTMEC